MRCRCCVVVCVQGYLTMADLYTFFREIHALWVNMGEYAGKWWVLKDGGSASAANILAAHTQRQCFCMRSTGVFCHCLCCLSMPSGEPDGILAVSINRPQFLVCAELEIYDVLDEVMDMVKPATPGRITKADLEACKMSGTVFSILSNVDQFYQYNFRYGGCGWQE